MSKNLRVYYSVVSLLLFSFLFSLGSSGCTKKEKEIARPESPKPDSLVDLIVSGEPAVQKALTLLRDEDPQNRILAINILTLALDEKAVPYIFALFLDKNEDMRVRQKALSALIAIGPPSIKTLEGVLNSDDEEIKKLAQFAIYRIKSAEK